MDFFLKWKVLDDELGQVASVAQVHDDDKVRGAKLVLPGEPITKLHHVREVPDSFERLHLFSHFLLHSVSQAKGHCDQFQRHRFLILRVKSAVNAAEGAGCN